LLANGFNEHRLIRMVTLQGSDRSGMEKSRSSPGIASICFFRPDLPNDVSNMNSPCFLLFKRVKAEYLSILQDKNEKHTQ